VATESGSSGLAEHASMMLLGLCMRRATWCLTRAAEDGSPQTPGNRGPGRAASGGAAAPEPPRAQWSGPE